jgi:2-enoate reductase
MKPEHKVLFTPIKIGSLEIKNRFVLAPMGPAGLCSSDGTYNYRGVEFYVARAKGGTGLIMTGVTKVENEIEKFALPMMPCPTLNPGNFIRTSKLMTERVHAYDAKIFLQLSAGFGRVAMPSASSSAPIAPSAIPHRWLDDVICRPLTIEEIKTYIRKFADSAEITQRAGFDGIEVHAVHEGYLLDQFAIAMFNQRTDEYGGSLENRLRFACEIVQAIKQRCGKNYPVSLRFSIKSFIKDWRQGALPGEAFEEKGRDIEEGIEAAKILEKAGYDAFNGDVGTYDSWYWNHPPMYQAKGLYLPYNQILKKALKVPVITAGRMDNPDLAAKAIESRQTDMIGLARPLMADPDLPLKVFVGKSERVRPCLSCQEGCMGRLERFGQISCAVNPNCGREADYPLTPTATPRKVMVVGAGIAGLEASRVAKLRGHRVTLYEQSDRIGGVVNAGGVPDFKEDDLALLRWYERELRELKVEIKLNSTVTREIIEKENPDALIVATGSKPKRFKIGDAKNVYTAEEVLLKREEPGQKCIVIGAGLVGCETALWLKNAGKEVTLVELAPKILSLAGPLCDANVEMLVDLLKFKKIPIYTEASVSKPVSGGFAVSYQGKEITIQADSAILAVGYASDRNLYEEVRADGREVYLLGDARKVQNIMYAVWDAYEVARTL